jgi:secreted trypsin-like serine protease
MASIRPLGSSQHFAGGALISEFWVITAAHYLQGRGHTSLTLVFGLIDLTSTGGLIRSHNSARIEINPTFDPPSRRNE